MSRSISTSRFLDLVREPLDLLALLLGHPAQLGELLLWLCELRLALASSLDEADCLLSPSVSLAGERADLALALGECVLRRREPCPLLLQLREEQRLGCLVGLGRAALDSTRIVFGLQLRRLHDAERRRAGHSTVVLVAPLDLRTQACTESGLHGELDPVLRCERARKIGAGHEAERDDRLTEPLPRHLLLNERAFELVVGQ